MRRTQTVVIGAGHAGLAISRCLQLRDVEHVVLERGRLAERWRSERWDSLRLLTPNWLLRLPGWRYEGSDPEGFLHVSELVASLESYRSAFGLPVRTDVEVEAAERAQNGFCIRAQGEAWQAEALVIATGHCDVPYVPPCARGLSPDIFQITASRYRNPTQLPGGSVLVVGACASGVQIAAELNEAGRSVTLAVGRHRRRPRRYRGRDILWWGQESGLFTAPADPRTERDFPAPQLVGSDDGHSLDLGILQERGVRLAGRVVAIEGHRVSFGTDLEDDVARAEREMREHLAAIDAWADARGLGTSAVVPQPVRPRPSPRQLDLKAEDIGTVVWATGYRRAYPWLRLDLLDQRGELRHRGGVTAEPGVYVIGLRRQRQNNSNFIDGAGDDAAFLAGHIAGYLGSA